MKTKGQNRTMKQIAIIILFMLFFQYVGVLLPFIEVRAEGEDEELPTATDSDGITWTYWLNENDEIVNLKYSEGRTKSTVTIPSELDGHKVISISGQNNKSILENYTGSAVTSVIIPEWIESIGAYTFYNCFDLRWITISKTVNNIDVYAFPGCQNFQGFIVDEENTKYKSINGVLYNKDVTELIKCPLNMRSIVIPVTVTSIGDRAFQWCKSLSQFLIAPRVETIADNAFNGCSSINIRCVKGSKAYNVARLASGVTPIEITTASVSFKDENLYNAIKVKLNKYLIDDFPDSKQVKLDTYFSNDLDTLDLSNCGISNISGLEKFKALSRLYLSNNNITSIEPITKKSDALSQLITLDLSGNPIDMDALNINYIKYLLKTVNLANTNIDSLSCFSNLSLSLTNLNLENNRLYDITDLQNITVTNGFNFKNQTIERKILKREDINVPIFAQAKQYKYNKNASMNYNTENCEINTQGVIAVNENFSYEKPARVTVSGGVLDGTVCSIYPEDEQNITVNYILDGDELEFEIYYMGQKITCDDIELYYSVDNEADKRYTGKIPLEPGSHNIKTKFFGKVIKDEEITTNIKIYAIRKDGKIQIFANSKAKIQYSFVEGEEFNEYNNPIENTEAKELDVKISNSNKIRISIIDTNNSQIIDNSNNGIKQGESIPRINGIISIELNNQNFFYSLDNINWVKVYEKISIEDRDAEKIYISGAKWDYNSYTNDFSYYKEYDIYDIEIPSIENLIGDFGDDSIQNSVTNYSNFNAESILGIYSKNNEDKYKYGKVYWSEAERESILSINDEIKVEKIQDNKIVQFTKVIFNNFVLKNDGKIYAVKETNADNIFDDLELIDGSNYYKKIGGLFALDNENNIWKYMYNSSNNKYEYKKCNYTLDGEVKEICTINFNSKNCPFVLYTNGRAVIYTNTTTYEVGNGILDISSNGRNYFALRAGSVIYNGNHVNLEELLEENELLVDINESADILTSNGNFYKAIFEMGTEGQEQLEIVNIIYNNDNKISNIKAIGNISYADNNDNIYYMENGLKAPYTMESINITKDYNELNQNKVTIRIQTPENTKTTKPDGTETSDNNINYEVTENGRYVFTFVDSQNRSTIRTVHVTNIQDRKITKVPQVSIVEEKVKLESDEPIEYSNDLLTWNDYVEELNYQENSTIYARIKNNINNEFEYSIIKISKNDQNLWNIENTEKREIQKEILTNSIGSNSSREVIKFEKGINDKKEESNSVFDYIAGIAENLIYSFSATDGKCAGCVTYEKNKSQITYNDIDSNAVEINEEEFISDIDTGISYSVISNRQRSIPGSVSEAEEIQKVQNRIISKYEKVEDYWIEYYTEYTYIDNMGHINTNNGLIKKFREYLGEDTKYTKIVGDGVTFYILTEEGEVYLVSNGNNQVSYYIYKKTFNEEPAKLEKSDDEIVTQNYYIYKLDLKDIIDIFDSCTALTKDGDIVSLLKDNEEDVSAVQEIQEKMDKYLLASHIGLKEGKLYDFSDVTKGRKVTAGEIIETDEGGYGIYSEEDKKITLFENNTDLTPIIPELAENEKYISVQDSNEQVPDFIDIAEYRDTYLLSLAYEEEFNVNNKKETIDFNYDFADKYTRCYALTKEGDLWAYIGGYIVDTGVNIDYFGPTINYDLNNSNWTNQDIELKFTANTTNKIKETTVRRGEAALESTPVENNDNLWRANITKNGIYTVTVKDEKLRTYSADLKVENIDKIAPEVNVGKVIEGSVNIEAQDITDKNGEYANSGIANIQIARQEPTGEDSWETFTGEIDSNGIMHITIDGVTEGQKIYVKATDKAGNTSEEKEVELKIKKLSLEKVAECDTKDLKNEKVSAGDIINYSVIITNEGNEIINSVTLTDELLNIESQIYQIEGGLNPGDSVKIELGTFTVTQEHIDNQQPIINTVIEDNENEKSEISTDVEDERKLVAIEKMVRGETDDINLKAVKKDDVLVYSVKVTNKGNTTIKNVILTDEKLNITERKYDINPLRPGESTIVEIEEKYTVTQEDIDKQEPIINIMTAIDGEKPSDTKTKVEPEKKLVALEKMVKGKTDDVNIDGVKTDDVLVYSVKVMNKGNTTINEVILTDEMLNITEKKYDINPLKPGETTTIENIGEYKVTEEDFIKQEPIINVITAQNGENKAEVSTPVEPTRISVRLTKKVEGKDKSVNLSAAKKDDVLVYSVEVKNTGNIDINSVKLTDKMLKIEGEEYTFDTIKPGESTQILLGEYTVTEEDVNKQQSIKNEVSAENGEDTAWVETPVETKAEPEPEPEPEQKEVVIIEDKKASILPYTGANETLVVTLIGIIICIIGVVMFRKLI